MEPIVAPLSRLNELCCSDAVPPRHFTWFQIYLTAKWVTASFLITLRILSVGTSCLDKAGTAVPGNQSSALPREPVYVSLDRACLRSSRSEAPRETEIYPLALSPDERPFAAEPDWAAVAHDRVYASMFTRAKPIGGPQSAWLSRRAAVDSPSSLLSLQRNSAAVRRHIRLDAPGFLGISLRAKVLAKESSDVDHEHVTGRLSQSQLSPTRPCGATRASAIRILPISLTIGDDSPPARHWQTAHLPMLTLTLTLTLRRWRAWRDEYRIDVNQKHADVQDTRWFADGLSRGSSDRGRPRLSSN